MENRFIFFSRKSSVTENSFSTGRVVFSRNSVALSPLHRNSRAREDQTYFLDRTEIGDCVPTRASVYRLSSRETKQKPFEHNKSVFRIARSSTREKRQTAIGYARRFRHRRWILYVSGGFFFFFFYFPPAARTRFSF